MYHTSLKACQISDIDECGKNLSCHVNANCTNNIGSHVCTCHTGYTGDGQTCSGGLTSFLQSQIFKAEGNLRRPFNSNNGARSSQTFILKCSFTP